MEKVAPHWGAWIEISAPCKQRLYAQRVAPHWGAWIEIPLSGLRPRSSRVAPHWGAWIEIPSPRNLS